MCIPTHNSQSTLPRVIEALTRQEFEDFEVLICDDASTDSTWELLESLKRPSVKIMRNDANVNLPGAMKRLFSLATGEFICMHHDHEYVEPTWLGKMISALDTYPSVGMAVPAYDVILSDGRRISRPSILEDRLFRAKNPLPGWDFVRVLVQRADTPVSAHGTVFRAATVRAVGGYSDRWGLASDEDLYWRVAMAADVAYVAEPVVVTVVRSSERRSSLGSLGAICTVSAFRREVVRTIFKSRGVARSLHLARLSHLEMDALLREVLSHWMSGSGKTVELINSLNRIPPLPSGGPVPSCWKRAVIEGLAGFLSFFPRVGQGLGRARRLLRKDRG